MMTPGVNQPPVRKLEPHGGTVGLQLVDRRLQLGQPSPYVGLPDPPPVGDVPVEGSVRDS